MAITQVIDNPDINEKTNSARIAFATLGCKVNQAETEALTRQFKAAGFTLVEPEQNPDFFVLNSCTVTHVADRKSRQMVRHFHRANPTARIVVTGCYAQLEAQELQAIEGVSLVVGSQEKARLLEMVEAMLSPSHLPGASFEIIEKPDNGRTRGLVKVQDGCNNFCSYCIVPYARGRSRSFPADEVIKEVKALVAAGYKEVVLTGVHAGAYGKDLAEESESGLAALIERILVETSLPRLRLSSIEPWDLEPSLFNLLKNPRLCRHLHLPLQSGSDRVLDRMRRHYTTKDFATLVNEVYASVPGIAVTTDIIVGFPGESEEEFGETLSFCREMGFAKTHVFKYSIRKGTLAASMPGHVDQRVKNHRSDELLNLSENLAGIFRRQFLGTSLDVLWEEPVQASADLDNGTVWNGLTDNYIRVSTTSSQQLANQIVRTRLTREHEDGLYGVIAVVT